MTAVVSIPAPQETAVSDSDIFGTQGLVPCWVAPHEGWATPMTSRVGVLSGLLLVVGVGLAAALTAGSRPEAAQAPVGLGTAASFAVLAGSTVTNTGLSKINGDMGVSPGTAVAGIPPGKSSNGAIHPADAVAIQAQADLTTAYDDAAGRTTCTALPTDLSGRRLGSGVYCGGDLGLTGTLTLDAQGNPNAVFIVQATSTLITASDSNVALINGAQACNVYWQVGSSATLGANSVFAGTVMARTSVAARTGASVTGRLLARDAAITLDTNTIATPTCAAPPTTTTATPVPPTTTATTTTLVTTTTTTTAPPAAKIQIPTFQLPARGAATAYGCGPALAYLAAYGAPGFSASCPAYSEGYQATTSCAGTYCSAGQRLITITVPCAAAYMNEASNSWVLSGLSNAPIDPYGYC